MNYVLTRLPCREIESKQSLLKDVWYKVDRENEFCTFLFENCSPISLNFKSEQTQKNCASFKYKGNKYFIITPSLNNFTSCATISYLNKSVNISVAGNIYISINGKEVLNFPNVDVTYDGYIVLDNYLILNFVGERNFVVIINGEILCGADYYDDVNIEEKEVYFLKRLNDSINHGRVLCVSKAKFESFLVYLDDDELNLKQEFLPFVFLDLVVAKNFSYAVSLLADEIKPKNVECFGEFLFDFDDFLPLREGVACLLKNGKPCGIAEFDCEDNKIVNIVVN